MHNIKKNKVNKLSTDKQESLNQRHFDKFQLEGTGERVRFELLLASMDGRTRCDHERREVPNGGTSNSESMKSENGTNVWSEESMCIGKRRMQKHKVEREVTYKKRSDLKVSRAIL